MTNYEYIKTLNLKEMAIFINNIPICPNHAPHCLDSNCSGCFERWLTEEVKKPEINNKDEIF